MVGHNESLEGSKSEVHLASSAGRLHSQPALIFTVAGLLFLAVALALFLGAGISLYRTAGTVEILVGGEGAEAGMTSRDIYDFYSQILSFFLAPLLLVTSAIACTFVGIRVLGAAGAVHQGVIPPMEYDVLVPAIRSGDEKVISQYIRLSSLLGVTGTFTKVGLTGLPLATIILTIILAVLGIFNQEFFDLARLTLGAFIGSYVQKRREEGEGPERKSAQET